MDQQNDAQLVTLDEAVGKVKKWAETGDWQDAKEGCEEILAVNSENKEILAILDKANKALKPQEAPAEPLKVVMPPAVVTPAPVTPTPVPKAAVKPVVKSPVAEAKKAEPKEESGNLGLIITSAVFIVIFSGLVYSFLQGWLNPFYNWILGLFGL